MLNYIGLLQGEALPKQGGTNEHVFKGMFETLEEEYKKNLRVFWYTGKDMIRPVNASKKQRNCHVKIMIVDDVVGIQGNGNQDAQVCVKLQYYIKFDKDAVMVPFTRSQYFDRFASSVQRMVRWHPD